MLYLLFPENFVWLRWKTAEFVLPATLANLFFLWRQRVPLTIELCLDDVISHGL